MLQKLRDKTSGWIATVILGLLIIPFAFVGIEQYLGQRTDDSVAKIDAPPTWWPSAPSFWPVSVFWQHDAIAIDEFRRSFEQARQQQRAQQGEAFDARAFESVENKRAILDGLIDARVQQLSAQRDGMVVSDAMVRKSIQEVPAFQVDGKFDYTRYKLALASQVPALTERQFEQQVRESLQQSMMTVGVAASNFVTAAEMDRLLQLMGEQRDVSVLPLPAPVADTGAVSAAEIQKWYEGHAGQYRAPEAVTIEYVEINSATLPAPAPADDATLRQRYEQEKNRFVEAEQRLASHILVRVPEGADAAAQKAAEQKAAQLATQAKAPGADFAALARANSDDSGSQAAGGDLGWVSKGMMVGPFEDALFAMKSGEVSAPVKSEFGWHVIQLRELKSGAQESFEQARESLAREQAEADRERAASEFSSRLVDLTLKNPSSLAPAAREMNIPLQKLGPIARTKPEGIAANPAVLRAAFSDNLIQDGTISDPIELAPGHSVMIRVTAHTPERALSLAQVRDQVIAAVRADRSAQAARKDADALVARMKGGETLEAISASRQLPPPQVLPGVPRGAPVPDASASEAIFAVAAPAAGKVTPGQAPLADGRIVLFAVSKVTPGDVASMPPQQREMLQQQIARIGGTDDMRALVTQLRKRVKVTVVERNL
ncbi:peptidyl-prolyl cis-trans isomerase [Lysobacter sp. S4-A87]|uniref:SurA N-terminal domain-containing protein n=1 Tax=Lysobacter sp. S4-A87 TaxID=2925843 RepID=UPI001F53905D|nr:SurA N-terminal domain-containing protein [Lysobacter sp. S4-A87]UNK50437.1 peptidyl-prolyl cis-trans isomerase [Lysobacter sp. S4-A87]